MIRFYGDVHRSFDWLEREIASGAENAAAHVQVGDLCVWPIGGLPPGKFDLEPAVPLYFIDGNWDYFPWLRGHERPVELMPNVIYVPRGTVLDLDGRRIAFLGGARSTMTRGRRRGDTWWPDEEIVRQRDVDAFKGRTADILVSHMPPRWVLKRAFGRRGVPALGAKPKDCPAQEALDLGEDILEPMEEQSCADLVEQAWELLGRPVVVSGHIHRPFSAPASGAYVLDGLQILDL